MAKGFQQLLPGLWKFQDTCNVYVLKTGRTAIAVDFGSGQWLQNLPALGVEKLHHVFLTHHHADQCAGLRTRRRWPFAIHAPVGEEHFLDFEQVRSGREAARALPLHAFPQTYRPLSRGLRGVLAPHARRNAADGTSES